jgi:predicted flap endonuclease-1-like 5' DNA nuclease
VPSGVFDPSAAAPASELDELKKSLNSRTLKLEAVSTQRDVLRSRIEKTERELERKSEELEKLHRQHESLRSLVALRADRIRELEHTLTQKNNALAERERTIADLKAKLKVQKPVLADDLTRIRGIGPKFAKKLSALGITSFRQIAAWSDADIDRYAEELGTRAKRIKSAGWRESAGELAGPPSEAPPVTETAASGDDIDHGC